MSMPEIVAACESLPGLGRGSYVSVPLSCALQNIGQRVIAFVAGVFINLCVGRRPGIFARPWLGPGFRIFDREAVKQRLRVDAREALDRVQVLGRAAVA